MGKHFAELDEVLKSSELLSAVKRVKSAKPAGKPVSADVIKQLEANRCWAQDWGKVRVADGFNPHHAYDVKFFGEVELGKFSAGEIEVEKGVKLTSGVYNSVIIDSVIGDGALVYNVGTLANYVVGANAVVAHT